MSVTYLGSLTVGGVAPSVSVSVAASLPTLQAQIAGLQATIVQLGLHPPTIAASLTFAQSMVTSISAAIAVGVQVPTATVQIAAITTFIASLSAQVSALVAFDAALGVGGIHAYAYSGAADQLGPEMTTELAGGFPGGSPSDSADALILGTTSPAAWVALSAILNTL